MDGRQKPKPQGTLQPMGEAPSRPRLRNFVRYAGFTFSLRLLLRGLRRRRWRV